MSNHEMPPQALLDPGMAIVTAGNLRGPILSVLRAACAPVKISEVLERYHPDMAKRVRATLEDLADLGMVHLSATHATALRGNGNPYRSTERRERVKGLAIVADRPEFTAPFPTHAPEWKPPKVVKKRIRGPRKERPKTGANPGPRRTWSVEKAIEMRNGGATLCEIAETMGVCHKSIQRALGLSKD